MNKRILLLTTTILSSCISVDMIATEFKDLSESTAQHLTKNAVYAILYALHDQQQADAGNWVAQGEFVNKTKQRAKEAVEALIEFGNQAAAAKQTNDPKQNLAGKTSALKLLTELKTDLIKPIEQGITTISANIASHARETDNDIKSLEKLEKDLTYGENLLATVTKEMDSIIATSNITEPSFSTRFTQHAKAVITNKWTKRMAFMLVACGIGKWLYNRYNQADESNDEESDTE
ncbi:MAG TPA: hypothetical protein VGT41_03220 [Candidatus Babeliales bacterium]|nr:hypothetical protein [Candidatus Babeliales bacterium]